MGSIWSATAELPAFPALRGDAKTEVLVIGGGLAGLLCARELTRAGVDCLLVEADRLCGGVTRNTTAKVTAQHGLIYGKLLRRFGAERARMYLEANLAALDRWRALCADLACEWEPRDSAVYSLDDRRGLEEELTALARLGFAARLREKPPLPLETAGAVVFPGQGQVHPLKFAAAAARGLRIYERTPVRELAGLTAVTDGGRIAAQSIIVATHFPFLNKHGGYFLKMYQHRSYVLALEGAGEVDGMYVGDTSGSLSFRSARGLLLLGGGAHRTGKSGGGWQELEAFAAARYPGARARARWAAQDCMTLDGAPYVGLYGKHTPGLYVAAGFNKWGMTSAMAAAMVLCDLVRGRESPWAPVFAPDRTVLRPQLAVNALESTVSLLTPTLRRCPHMGCALKWNPAEHSWDCPCHGSRFTAAGALLDNPATGGLDRRAR